MGITFAILKDIKGEDSLVLEYNEERIAERIPKLVLEKLPLPTVLKKKYSRDEIKKAVDEAWDNIVGEFKEETVKIK